MKTYKCKNCGAVLYWNAAKARLECEYCGKIYTIKVPEQDDNTQASDDKTDKEEKAPEVERETESYDKATDDSDHDDLVVYKCTNCGAEVITSKKTVATICAYCGEAISMSHKLQKDFKPDYVVPFSVSKEEAIKKFKDFCASGPLTPKDFYENAKIEKIKGLYVPAWLHSFKNQVDVNARQTVTRSSLRSGYDKVESIDTYIIDGIFDINFEKIPADALEKFDDELMGAIEPFDYSKMEPFSPLFMSGFYAEEKNEEAQDSFGRALIRARRHTNDIVRSNIKVQSLEKHNISVSLPQDVSIRNKKEQEHDIKSEYVMLPVWLFSIKYRDEYYRVAVNGQSGKMAGKIPSDDKIMLKNGIIIAAIIYGANILIKLISMLL